MKLTGVGVSGGRSCARLFVFGTEPWAGDVKNTDDYDRAAHDLLSEALERTRSDLLEVEARMAARVGAEHSAIFQTHRVMLDDEAWLDPIRARIDGGESAATAVWRVSEDLAEELRQIDDPYMRGRAIDIIDLAQRVLGQLGCSARPRLPGPGDGEVIIVARELTPSDTIDLEPEIVRGIVSEDGTRTSHAAILARQLGIPAVVGVSGLLEAVRGAQTIAVDGDAGLCELDPDPEVEAALGAAAPVRAPVVRRSVSTADGVAVTVAANVSSAQEVVDAVAMGADAIGLYRTEFLFLRGGGEPPDEAAQVEAYSAAGEAAEGRSIVFRTLDVGAD
jgi:phosphotransferase system enzyme I (PtsI)